MAIIVLDRSGQASMPSSEKRAHQPSERGRACEHRLIPLAIRLDDRHQADWIIQPRRVELDPDCKVTGVAVVREVDANAAVLRCHAVALFLAQLIHRGLLIRLNLGASRHDAPTAPQSQAPLLRRSVRQSALARRLAGAPTAAPYRHGNGLGSRTEYNWRRLDLPKTRAIVARCMGAVVTIWHRQVLAQPVRCAARDSPPSRGYLVRCKQTKGFQMGDLVHAKVLIGKEAGTQFGRVAVHATDSFNIQTSAGATQGVSHRYCRSL
ncbi:RRXRR domain-containing protein [Cupriavidus basilensis]|uniref:RRXRR domain-containing protein n=1 Tax=Cupriavidus basilensis TaxID=68895 RepID=UPI003D357B19